MKGSMRTAVDDAQDLADYIDAFLVKEYGMEPGGFHQHVMRPFEASEDSRLDLVESLDMSPEAGDTGVKYGLWVAHHLARAKRLHAQKLEVRAYQELLEAYKCSNNMTAYVLILKGMVAKDAPIRKAQASRHLAIKEVEAYAVARFREGTFPSAHKASIELTDEVRKYAAEKGKPLSEDRASKTIYEWLLRSMKDQN